MTPRVLVVDDEPINRRILARAVTAFGCDVAEAADGDEALELLRSPDGAVDVVLLDLLMPVLDGFETLQALKADPALVHLPVIMVSAVEDLESVIRCIELGAMDYLPKPVHEPLLRARLRASLAAKRLRDVERDYLAQVERVIEAAVAIEAGTYDAAGLEPVAQRDDACGTLARVFQRMAREVAAREAALRREVAELRIEIDGARRTRKVADVTDSDAYRRLADTAGDLKRILSGEERRADG